MTLQISSKNREASANSLVGGSYDPTKLLGIHGSSHFNFRTPGLRKEEDPKLDARLGNTERLSFKNKKRKERIREGKRGCADSSGGKVLTFQA